MHLALNREDAIAALSSRRPSLWFNDRQRDSVTSHERAEIARAAARLRQFEPLIAQAFPETAVNYGRIESPLTSLHSMGALLGVDAPGTVLVKADHALPVGGSIKARGGANAVLSILEEIALRSDCTMMDEGVHDFLGQARQSMLSNYRISVGSTGNLGLSIGTYAARLGLKATVHMSSDAKRWKKEELRARGVTVIEHAGDYLQAVAAGRLGTADQRYEFFIDDEASETLMYGYATAAAELDRQLRRLEIFVGSDRPLFVYLPCGVGGAPAGVTIGLNALYGSNVHCFFAEPVNAPCVMLDVLTEAGPGGPRHVREIGLSGETEADGLAVPRASELASSIARRMAAGFYTVHDKTMLELVPLAHQIAAMRLEPSATAGFPGAHHLMGSAGQSYLHHIKSRATIDAAVHVIWTTGGMLLPDSEFDHFLRPGTTTGAS